MGPTESDKVDIDDFGREGAKNALPLLLSGIGLWKFKQEFLLALCDLKFWCINIQARHHNLAQCCALFEAATDTERLKGKSKECED